MRLDYVPKAKAKMHHKRKRRNLGTLTCEICHTKAVRHTGRQKLCGRRTCKSTRDKIAYRGGRGEHRRAVALRGEPMLDDLGPPICGCGEKVAFGSDPMTGASIEYCPKCGERPLPTYGRRGYDQRIQLEAYLRERQDSEAKPPEADGPTQQFRGLEAGNSCTKFFKQ